MPSYEKAIAVAADDYRGYSGLGEMQWELGQTQAAIDTWKRGLESVPAAAGIFDLALASGLVRMGRFDEAENYLDRLALATEKPSPGQNPAEKALSLRKYQLLRAHWLRGKNQPFQAIALAHGVATGTTVSAQERSVALEAWSLLADAYMSLGRWAEAAGAFDMAVELAPKASLYSGRYRTLAAAAWSRPISRTVHSGSCGPPGIRDGPGLRVQLAAAIFGKPSSHPRTAAIGKPCKPPWPMSAWPMPNSPWRNLRGAHAGGGNRLGPSGFRGPPCRRRPRRRPRRLVRLCPGISQSLRWTRRRKRPCCPRSPWPSSGSNSTKMRADHRPVGEVRDAATSLDASHHLAASRKQYDEARRWSKPARTGCLPPSARPPSASSSS